MENGFDFSKPLHLAARLTLPSRVLLSPMQGVMTETMLRVICRMRLAPCLFPPFYSTGGASIPNPSTFRKKISPFRKFSEIPLIWQLIGHEATPLAETAAGFADAGVNGINLNFACPSKTVTGSGNGSACLKSVSLPAEITETVRKALPDDVSLSVKIRVGWDSAVRSADLVRGLADAGADLIICHYRTACELYDVIPDAEKIRAERLAHVVSAAGSVPVFGNGDIDSYRNALELVRETGCTGVAIGRAFLRSPGIIRIVSANGTHPEHIATSEEFLAAIRENLTGISRKHRHGWYLECVKMTYGSDSPEFADAVHSSHQDDFRERKK